MRWDPVAEIVEQRDAVIVRLHLAGVRPDDVHIEAQARHLVVGGIGGPEVPHASFVRTFPLPDDVEGEGAIAIMSDGVLTVRIPRRRAEFAA